jgi:hypothetical protein
MSRNPEKLKRFADPMVSTDGQAIWIKVETASRTLDIAIPLGEIGDAVQFLVGCADFVVTHSDHPADEAPPRLETMEWAPIPARGMGLGAGRSPDETMLVIQLACCQLAFPIAGDDLRRLADDFARSARTLSAGHGRPN